MTKFSYTILYVTDIERSISFYENAFGLARKFVTPDNTYGELVTGETTLSFASIELASSNLRNGFIESNRQQKPFGIEVGFVVDNVQEVVDRAVKFGALLIEVPKTKPWGQVVAYVRDPDGFLIEVCTSVG